MRIKIAGQPGFKVKAGHPASVFKRDKGLTIWANGQPLTVRSPTGQRFAGVLGPQAPDRPGRKIDNPAGPITLQRAAQKHALVTKRQETLTVCRKFNRGKPTKGAVRHAPDMAAQKPFGRAGFGAALKPRQKRQTKGYGEARTSRHWRGRSAMVNWRGCFFFGSSSALGFFFLVSLGGFR